MQGPIFVSKVKIASIASTPARVTRRGGVRPAARATAWGAMSAVAGAMRAAMAAAPEAVRRSQVKARMSRQWQSSANSVAMRAAAPEASAAPKSSSHASAVAVTALLVSMPSMASFPAG
ncbi:MAG TPA: hypothetical protein VK726_23560 [Acetobacteraceae bacterium]|nr:hypothetical protein [Acetobacteraceae bacterium]